MSASSSSSVSSKEYFKMLPPPLRGSYHLIIDANGWDLVSIQPVIVYPGGAVFKRRLEA